MKNRFVLEDEDIIILGNNDKTINGGKGSGNFGHKGRPGEVGGSAPQGSTSSLSDDNAEVLEVEAIEKWSFQGKWTDYKKKLEDKYSEKYPDYEIKIKKAEVTAGGSSGPGFIDYIVWGTKKDTEDDDYESLRAEEDSLGYSLELEYGSNIVDYVKEQLGVVKTVEKYLDKVPEDMREQMVRGLETTKKDLERVIESHKKTLGDDLTAENFEEKYDAHKKSMQTRLDEVRAKISKMRSEKRAIDLVTDSKTPDMDYIGSEKKRIDIARKSIGIFEDDGSLASDWLNGEIGEAKPEIRKAIEKDKELRQACLSQMYYDSNSKTDFKKWLKTPVTLKRVQFSDRINKDSGFLSFSQYGEWEGTGQGHNKTFPGDILEVKIKPQDTLGSIPAREGYAYAEKEVMVPTELVTDAMKKKNSTYNKVENSGEKEAKDDTSDSLDIHSSDGGADGNRNDNQATKSINGGAGSGNFGHAGRPDLVGGSSPREASVFDNPWDSGDNYWRPLLDAELEPGQTYSEYYRDAKGIATKVIDIAPEDYLRLIQKGGHSVDREHDDFIGYGASEKYRDKILSGEKLATPDFTLEADGSVMAQEGRHRAEGARLAGLKKIPVMISYKVAANNVDSFLEGFNYTDITKLYRKMVTDHYNKINNNER